MSTWEERMSAKAKARIAAQEAEEDARRAEQLREWEVVNPSVPGGDECLIADGEHAGHRTHIHAFHGNLVVCQCGAPMGCFSVVLSEDDPPRPDSCPVCTARGIAVYPPQLNERDGWRPVD